MSMMELWDYHQDHIKTVWQNITKISEVKPKKQVLLNLTLQPHQRLGADSNPPKKTI